MATIDQLVTNTTTVTTAMTTAAQNAISTLNQVATAWSYTAYGSVAMDSIPAYVPATVTPITPPTIPDAPDISALTTPTWDEAFWTNLKTIIGNHTSSLLGAANLNAVIDTLNGTEADKLSNTLYSEELARKQQVLRDLNSAADANTGALGYTFPNCMTTALKLDAQQKFQFDMHQVAKELIKNIYDWAKSNYQFIFNSGINAHNSDVEFATKYLSALLQGYANQLNAIIEAHKATVQDAVSKAEIKLREYAVQSDNITKKYAVEQDARMKLIEADLRNADSNTQRKIQAATAIMNGASAVVASVNQTAIGVLNA